METEILQNEIVEIIEKVIDPDTNIVLDETIVSITPIVVAPEPRQYSVGELKNLYENAQSQEAYYSNLKNIYKNQLDKISTL